MTEDDKAELYTALLRGIANEAQDRLCAADKQHAWGPWKRTRLEKDTGPIGVFDFSAVCDEVYHVRADRVCLNCGKEQMARA